MLSTLRRKNTGAGDLQHVINTKEVNTGRGDLQHVINTKEEKYGGGRSTTCYQH